MDTIAVYEGRDFDRRRRFELSAATIRATGKSPRLEYDTTLKLAWIDPEPELIKVVDPRVYIGATILCLGVIILLVAVTVAEFRDAQGFPWRPMRLAGLLGAGGLGLALAYRRPIEYARFRSNSGAAILAIPRDRADAGEFDSFVALLIKQIGIAKGAAQAGPFRDVPSESPR
jgi:hypothetical protein